MTIRTSARLALLICCAGARMARAEGDAGAAPAAPASPAPSSEAPGEPPPPEAGPGDTGGGLFEQSNAAAAVAPSAGAAAAAPAAGPFTLTGYVRGDMFAGKVSGQDAAEMKAGYGELDLTLRTAKETYGDGFAEARIRYGLQADGLQTTAVDLREAYVNAYLGPLDLRIGQQIIVWGRADALNPTNNLTPACGRSCASLLFGWTGSGCRSTCRPSCRSCSFPSTSRMAHRSFRRSI
jgi:hypothetical protein